MTPTEQVLVSIQEVLRSQQAQLVEQRAQHQEQIQALVRTGDVREIAVGAPRAPGRTVSEFQKLKPPVFNGSSNPEDIFNFLQQLEDAFTVAECSERDKLLLGPYQLREDAGHWWRGEKDRLGDRQITWAEFKEMLESKFLPQTVRDQLHDEFLHIRQGNRSVAEYDREFTRLSRFASRIVSTERERAAHFLQGLQWSIQDKLVALRHQTYTEVFEAALEVERMNWRRSQSQQGEKRSAATQHPAPAKRFQGQMKTPSGNLLTFCNKCQRFGHTEQNCLASNGGCYRCGKFGHGVRDCRAPASEVFPTWRERAPQQYQRPAAPVAPVRAPTQAPQRAPFQPQPQQPQQPVRGRQ